MPATPSPISLLKTVFGYDAFKPLQCEVIQNVLQKRDTLAIMPTGGGKSLCYQIPALTFTGLTVVVSPLIALMKDQVEQLTALGIPALFLNSSLSFEAYQANMARVRSGETKLLYVAPETLLTPRLFNLLAELPLACLTIDEAHCISEWGHDFRPEYRQIVAVRQRFPKAVCLALTATATERVRADIRNTLHFQDSNEFVASFDRENLYIEVQPKSAAVSQAVALLEQFKGQSGIVYCFSRKQVDDLALFLAGRGYSVRPYHAGLEDDVRRQNQEAFIRDDVQIIVATIAFGMGINKPNVRFVIHYDLPKSIEGYYQEIGRAGRDGLPAHCLLLYSAGDVVKQMHFIREKGEPERQVAMTHLNLLTRYAESTLCRRMPLLAYFGETYTVESCGMCDNCRRGADRFEDITIPAQKFLSCVARTGERFAALHVINVLRGVDNEKTQRYGHQHISTFGIGKDLTQKQWQLIGQQMLEQGFLEQSPDLYRTLKLTRQAHDALKARTPIRGLLHPEVPSTAKPAGKAGGLERDETLFALLRQKRKALADEANVPPYVIFSDRTLVEMAAYYPMTEASLLEINGVGRVKLERYGQVFLHVIREYCEAHHLAEKAKPSRETVPVAQMALKPRHVVVAEAYNDGQSVSELMAAWSVKQTTILDHLWKYAGEGNALRRSDDLLDLIDLPETQKQAALQAFERFGVDYLRPVFDELNAEVSFDVLKVLRLYLLAKQAAKQNPAE
ncbi:MAG: DNA helicase RecQ [Chloroflexota bacterium]